MGVNTMRTIDLSFLAFFHSTIILFFLWKPPSAWGLDGTVLDSNTLTPISGALVTYGNRVVSTNARGEYYFSEIEMDNSSLNIQVFARAIGHNRTSALVNGSKNQTINLKLMPIAVNALYLSYYGIGNKKLRDGALDLIKQTQINALVIDVKGDKGMIPYRSNLSLANSIGACNVTTVDDMGSLLQKLKNQGIYLIARIVTFKDDPLAKAKSNLAVRSTNGSLFRDNEGLAWSDPSQTEVWQYNIDIATEAASLGFDEIQFDYVRFPDHQGLVFNIENTQQNRIAAINGFLKSARQALISYNVFLSVDIFGYVPWNSNDTDIGQTLDGALAYADYVCPMLYPSGFQFGIPQYRNPMAAPYAIVYYTLEQAIKRSKVSPLRFRPWLQAFRDYAFDRRAFTASEIKAQIDAANLAGTSGWMLWNPRNIYYRADLPAKMLDAAP